LGFTINLITMPKKSAGILAFRRKNGELEVFLTHPGGPFYKKRDLGIWTIPKGEFENEQPLEAAKREFEEETGHKVSGDFIEMTPFKQKSGKWVYSWSVETDFDANDIRSNTFKIQFPPKIGPMREYPEVDRAGWFTIEEAELKVVPYQLALLTELAEKIENSSGK